jgi:hypothetical protein
MCVISSFRDEGEELILAFKVFLGLSFVGWLVCAVYDFFTEPFDPPSSRPYFAHLAPSLVLSIIIYVTGTLWLQLSQMVHYYTQRTQAVNKLKTLAKAMHNYTGEHNGRLPRVANGRPGEPGGLSWRVALLPYLGEEELYREFHLDEPWDSPHNLQLLPRMPDVFRSVRNYREPYHTHYQIIAGPDGLFRDNRAPAFPKDFHPNGSGNTLLIAEAAEPVPWTKPADLVFERDGPLPKFGGGSRNGTFYFAMGDGSVDSLGQPDAREEAWLRYVLKPDSDGVVRHPHR